MIRLLYVRKISSISALDLAPATREALLSALEMGQGAILLTGPTGSGKSTTLYAAMLHLEQHGRNVVTVEDPVEIPVPGIIQVQVAENAGLDYPTAIRSVMRHDPDALLIGEIRDPVSAKIAMEAAASGHLTLTSVHAGSVVGVLERLTGLGLDPRRCIEATALIINQRLLPRLCARCKVHDLESSRRYGTLLWKAVGCQGCDYSGYDGRVVISEYLPLVDPRSKSRLSRDQRPEKANGPDTCELNELVIPWTDSLQHHLANGGISAAQFQHFLDTEITPL